jgi:periplasmic divalent cation tolerance protein
MKPVHLLYIPVPDRETGLSLCHLALKKRLAACGNLHGPIESLYEWEGEMRREAEHVLILKTTPERLEALAAEIEAAHPYDCPCVLRLSGDANDAFGDWVGASVKG